MSLDEDHEGENGALRRQVGELETQLVAYDAVLDGNIELAQHIAPGVFEVRRRHAVERIPLAVLREVFPIPARFVSTMRPPQETDDDYYLRQIWTGEDRITPRRIFVSCALRDGEQSPICLTSATLSQCEPGGTRPLTRAHTNLPRRGDSGLPSGFTWLVTSWSLELRDTAGWEIGCSSLQHSAHGIGALAGVVEFRYFQRRISERPLSDALRPHGIDLCCVMREGMDYEIRMEVTAPLVVRPLDPAAIPSSLPRLYVFLEVIARELAVW